MRVRTLGAGMALAAILALAGCGSSPAGSASKKQVIFTAKNIGRLMQDAESYKGASVKGVVGRVFNVDTDEGVLGAQLWLDEDRDDQIIAVIEDSSFDLKDGDYLRIRSGEVIDEFKGENAFGAKLRVPRVLARRYEVVDATAMHPAVVTLGPQTKRLGDVRYTISKVEFAEDQTRVYVEAINTGEEDAQVDAGPSVVSQGRQMESEVALDQDLPELSYELSPGATTEGVLVYPAMKPHDLQIRFTGYDYTYDEAAITFEFGGSPPSGDAPSETAPREADSGGSGRSDDPGKLVACDANISAGAARTTCPFAENTFYEYFVSGESDTLSVWSRATESYHEMSCSGDGTTVSCENSDGAYVQMSQTAVDAYSDDQAERYAETHDVG